MNEKRNDPAIPDQNHSDQMTSNPSQKRKKTKYRLIYLSILLVALCLIGVLAYSLVKLNTEYIPQQKEAQRFDQLRELAHSSDDGGSDSPAEPSDPEGDLQNTLETTTTGAVVPHYTLDQLFGMNSDMKAWLYIPDTVVDYPVMHTPDDVEYYLHTDFDGYYSFSGCLFVGDHCDIDSDIFVIYGHNMNNGSMFGSIDYYTDADYWASHPDVVLTTRDGSRLYRIFAAFSTKIYDQDDISGDFRYYDSVGERTQEEYDAAVREILALSSLQTGETPHYPAQIVYLSTCAYHTDNGRFVLAAYRIA